MKKIALVALTIALGILSLTSCNEKKYEFDTKALDLTKQVEMTNDKKLGYIYHSDYATENYYNIDFSNGEEYPVFVESYGIPTTKPVLYEHGGMTYDFHFYPEVLDTVFLSIKPVKIDSNTSNLKLGLEGKINIYNQDKLFGLLVYHSTVSYDISYEDLEEELNQNFRVITKDAYYLTCSNKNTDTLELVDKCYEKFIGYNNNSETNGIEGQYNIDVYSGGWLFYDLKLGYEQGEKYSFSVIIESNQLAKIDISNLKYIQKSKGTNYLIISILNDDIEIGTVRFDSSLDLSNYYMDFIKENIVLKEFKC